MVIAGGISMSPGALNQAVQPLASAVVPTVQAPQAFKDRIGNAVLQPVHVFLDAVAAGVVTIVELGDVVDIVDVTAVALTVGKADIAVPGLYEVDSMALKRVPATDRFLHKLPGGKWRITNTSGAALTAHLIFWTYDTL